ncbi:hypothetical protein BGZ76_008959 [Entomortierella beljakovae]|nr:hypothetical protein BGZ76_008959 [Entomortierella beljakovae]
MLLVSRRGGSSLRGKPNSTKLSAPLPVNLPSRRHEKAGYDSLVASGSSWGSPSTPSTSVLASTSPAASPAANEGLNSTPGSGATSAAGQGGDSPQLDSTSSPPVQKATPRAWGVVAHTSEQHLDEFPTAAEASKKLHDQHDNQNHGNTNNTTANTNTNSSTLSSTAASTNATTNSVKQPNTSNNVTSGEPMAKTVSALSGGADNWDEVDEDEGVDFLNAEAIEFADGAVLVAAAVAQTNESLKEEEPALTSSQLREEKIVERGEVDFNRSWPSRPQNGPGSTPYQSHHDQTPRYGSQDRPHNSLWHGGTNDRRPSVDRTQNHHPGQRRESFGNRDHYQGAPRRDSLGPKEPFSGPRRDSANYRDPQERRDSYNRSGSFSRDRDPYHHHDNDYNMDRRPSHDRPPYTSDRFPDRHQRDFQLLTRPKESSNDRLGPHDMAHNVPYTHAHHSSPGPRGAQEAIHPRDMDGRAPYSHAHMNPTGAMEFDRPAQVTEDQREAMRHAADEARKRREEVEKTFEEGRARARARADELAKKAEQEAKAKEEAAAKEAEQLAKEKKEEEDKAKAESAAVTSPVSSNSTDNSNTSRDPGHHKGRPLRKELTEGDREEAIARWQALPEKLLKEESDRISRIREEKRLRAEQEQVSQTTGVASSTTDTGTSTVGPWRRSGNVTTGKLNSSTTSKPDSHEKRDEKSKEAIKTTAHSPNSGSQEVRVDQLEEVMHRIEESLQVGGASLKPLDGSKQSHEDGDHAVLKEESTSSTNSNAYLSTEIPTINTQHHLDSSSKDAKLDGTSQGSKTVEGIKVRDLASIPKEDSAIHEATKDEQTYDSAGKEEQKESNKSNLSLANGRIPRSAVATFGKGSYPAKLIGVKGTAKISQISKIHARLSLQSAGDIDLQLPEYQEKEANLPLPKDTTTLKNPTTKRNSLLNSVSSTIFPSNVEKAAKNRGSMSFMVDSEIDSPSAEVDTVLDNERQTVTTSQWDNGESASAPHIILQTSEGSSGNESTKQSWDSAQSDSNDLSKDGTYHVQQQDVANNNNVSQGMVITPAVYMMSPTGPGVGSPMGHMWNGVESSQAGPGIAPGGHPGQPYSMVVPYFSPGYPVNGPPMYYVLPPRGMPHPMGQFPGGVVPSHASHGSIPVSPRDGISNINGGIIEADQTPGQGHPSHSSGGGELKAENANGSHPWLPRFSAAGDAPSQQVVASPNYPVHMAGSQHANIIAAANINRVPHSRPFNQQQQQQQQQQHHHNHQNARIHNSGAASLESSFQEGSQSPSSVDGWDSDSAITASGMDAGNQSNSGGGGGGGGNGSGSGNRNPTSSWGSGNGRASANGPGGPYGGYQHHSPSSSTQQHHHHSGGYRGGRGGGYNNNNTGFNNYREFRPRGGYGGHMGQQQVHHNNHHGHHGQVHSSNFHYGHQGPQHNGPGTGGNGSGSNSGDHHQGHGRGLNSNENSNNSFGSNSFTHNNNRQSHNSTATSGVGSSNSLQY